MNSHVANTNEQTQAPPKSIIYAIILLIFVYVGRVQELHPILAHLYLGKVAIAIAFLLFLAYKDKIPCPKALWSYPQGKYLIAICALAILSIPGSVWPGQSFSFIFSFYWKLILFVFLLFRLVSGEDGVRRLSWGLALSNFILCVAAIVNPIYVGDRLTASATYDPNDFALLLVMSLPVIYCLAKEERGAKKLFLVGVLLLSIFIVPQTGSRGGLLALGTVIVVAVLKRGWKKALVILPLSGVLLFVVLSLAAPQQFERFLSIGDLSNDYNISARGGRVDIWMRSLDLMIENPVFGSGSGTFLAALGQANEAGGKWMTAHNSFLQIGVELGGIALILHLVVIWKMIRFARRSSTPWGAGLEVGLYAYCVGGFFLSWAYGYVLYLFFALSLADNVIDEASSTKLCEDQ